MVKIIVKSSTGKPVSEFMSNPNDSLSDQLKKNNAEVPTSCGIGACGTCMVKILSGKEFINEEALGQKMIDIEPDHVLSCISSITSNAPENGIIEIQLL